MRFYKQGYLIVRAVALCNRGMNRSKQKVVAKKAKQSSKDQQLTRKQQSNPQKVAASQTSKHQKPAPKKNEHPPAKDDKSDFLPGQKYKSPEQDSGALAFYTSLYEQNPNSQMAQKYCLQYGLMDPSEAQRILKSQSRGSRGKR